MGSRGFLAGLDLSNPSKSFLHMILSLKPAPLFNWFMCPNADIYERTVDGAYDLELR